MREKKRRFAGKAVSFFLNLSHSCPQKRLVTVRQLNAQTPLCTLSIGVFKPPADSLITLPAPAEQNKSGSLLKGILTAPLALEGLRAVYRVVAQETLRTSGTAIQYHKHLEMANSILITNFVLARILNCCSSTSNQRLLISAK